MKVLFYGFQHGHIFSLYEKVKKNEELEIVACIEDDANKREEIKETKGIVCSSENLEYWLNKDVDIVAIGDKYGKRGKAVIKALKAGKHVIADKPICTSREELNEIIAISKEKGLKVGCMLDLRDAKGTQIVKKILTEKTYGEVKNIIFTGNHCVDYAHRPSWYFEEGMHGGTINDIAIHGVDLVTYLTGLKFAKINSARTWNSYAYKTPDFKDSAIFMAELDNGAGVLADVSYSAPSQVFTMPTYWDFKFWCKDALVHYNFVAGEVTVYAEGETGPKKIILDVAENDYLASFIKDVKENVTEFTDGVLLATSQTLAIQEHADK